LEKTVYCGNGYTKGHKWKTDTNTGLAARTPILDPINVTGKLSIATPTPKRGIVLGG